MKELVLNLRHLNKGSVAIAGGKGAQLGELISAGINVPAGFVVLTSAFDLFLEEANLRERVNALLEQAVQSDQKSIKRASEAIRALINSALIPGEIGKNVLGEFGKLGAEFVAVRSSATAEDAGNASWAGELETYTNQTRETVLEAVKNCWSSLFTPRAIFYRKEKNIGGSISVAVVVQKMVDSEVSGVAFSVHPVSKNKNQVIIEAGFGLGESIVSGAITPDSYIVNKQEMFIETIRVNAQEKMLARKDGQTVELEVPKNVREKQKLSGDKIAELAGIVKRIENHYGFAQDIEWALVGGQIFILQSRPVTA